MSIERKKWFGVLAITLLASASWVFAQADTEPSAVADTGEPDTAFEADADTSPPAPVKALPSQIRPLASRALLLDVVSNGERLYAVGERGTVIGSADGKDWTQVVTPVRSTLNAIYFTDKANGWAVGHDAAILRTRDAGQTWTLQNFEPALEKPLLDVLFVNAQQGFAVGAYGLFYATQDGGDHWTEVDSPIREEELHFNAIAQLASGELFIAGEQGTLAVSADGGQTWSALASPYEGSFFGALPYGDKGVMIFGLRGNVYISDDARGGWRKLELGTVATLFGGVRLQGGGQVLVGLAGEVRRIGSDGTVTDLPLVVTETDADGSQRRTELAGTLSGVIPVSDGLLVVGENGVVRISTED